MNENSYRLIVTFDEKAKVALQKNDILVTLSAPLLCFQLEHLDVYDSIEALEHLMLEYNAAIIRGLRSYHEQREKQGLFDLREQSRAYALIDVPPWAAPVFHYSCNGIDLGCAYYIGNKSTLWPKLRSLFFYPNH